MNRRRSLLVLATAWLGAACAQHAGGRATQGAIDVLREEPPPGAPVFGIRVGRTTTEGALAELTSPEGLSSVSTVVEAAVTHSLEAALRPPPSVQGRAGGPPVRSLLGRVSGDSAAAFAAAFAEALRRDLGPDGRGPLAASLGATAAQISGAAVQGARGELPALFPGCEGQDRRACLELGVRSLGKAAAMGFVEGIAQSGAWAVLGLAFLLGVAVVLVAQGLGRLLRRRPAAHREAHP
jgi:hypothetical protein